MKNPKNPSSSVQNRKCGVSTRINAFHNLLQIKPDIFKDLILDDLVSYTIAENKGKSIPQKENTTRSIQARLEVLEEEGEEENLKTHISL